MTMRQVKYRSYTPGLSWRRTKLEVPGWGGQREPRKDGSMEQAWHCLPFSEGARYGIELFYPHQNELRVSVPRMGNSRWRATSVTRPEGQGGEWPPFRTFGDLDDTYQVSLDLEVEEGFAIRTEPHPRFFTDPDQYDANRCTGADPAMVADGVLSWCSSPAEGSDYIFRPGEPFAQIIDPAGGSRVRPRSNV